MHKIYIYIYIHVIEKYAYINGWVAKYTFGLRHGLALRQQEMVQKHLSKCRVELQHASIGLFNNPHSSKHRRQVAEEG